MVTDRTCDAIQKSQLSTPRHRKRRSETEEEVATRKSRRFTYALSHYTCKIRTFTYALSCYTRKSRTFTYALSCYMRKSHTSYAQVASSV